MMGLLLLQLPLDTGKPMFYLILTLKIFVIFKAALVSISGQHSEISINQAKKSCQVKSPYAKKRNRKTHQCKYHQETIESVVSIPSHHKSVHFFSHAEPHLSKLTFLLFTIIELFLNCKIYTTPRSQTNQLKLSKGI